MGYYTYFDLTIKPEKYTIGEIISKVAEIMEDNSGFCYPFEYYLEDYFDDNDSYELELNSEEGYKWYDHERDMRMLSLLFPEAMFILYGKGEEAEDQWEKQFQNGRMRSKYIELRWPDEFSDWA